MAKNKHSLGTTIKMKLFDNFQYVVKNPSVTDLQNFYRQDRFSFKYNNKTFGCYIDISPNKQYFEDYYKHIGVPYIFGLYNLDKTKNIDILIGTVTLILRHDNKIWQIMDLKIAKEFRGKHSLDKLISSTLSTRILKSNAYYALSMNPNPKLDAVCNHLNLPKLKNRGKMYIYTISFENIKKILSTLESFYCSEIGFVNTNDDRLFIDSAKNIPIKMLHLHHNTTYRDYDFREPQRGYIYCFSIHESNEFIISSLKQEYNIEPSANATIYSNDFKTDWSKFVKTYEI